MKYEDLFCTLEQAKKLFELGINQKTHFYFYEEIVNGKTRFPVKPLFIRGTASWRERNEDLFFSLQKIDKNGIFAAFTAQELGDMLPKGHLFYHDTPHWHCKSTRSIIPGMCGLTLAQAMAFELLSLIEIKQITVEGINKALSKTKTIL